MYKHYGNSTNYSISQRTKSPPRESFDSQECQAQVHPHQLYPASGPLLHADDQKVFSANACSIMNATFIVPFFDVFTFKECVHKWFTLHT